jgi:hypothetical protein
MKLIGQVGEANPAGQLPPHDALHVRLALDAIAVGLRVQPLVPVGVMTRVGRDSPVAIEERLVILRVWPGRHGSSGGR